MKRARSSSSSFGPTTARVDIAVVGAGVIGAAVARELVLAGRSVTVFERGQSWASGCSWGNAGLLVPSHAGPWAVRADIVQAARWLLRPDSPLGLRARPELVPFMARLLSLGPDQIAESVRVSRGLCVQSLAMHAALGAELGTGFTQAGMLDVYSSPRLFERGVAGAAAHQAAGVNCAVLDAAAVADAEPGLVGGVVGGVLFHDEAHCDPAVFVEKLGGDAQRRGVDMRSGVSVLSLSSSSVGVELVTSRGVVRAEHVVVATGAFAGQTLGRRLMLQGGKGYTVDCSDGDRVPVRRPLILQEARVAVTPLSGRLRLAGTMEFRGLDESLDACRAASVRRAGVAMLPAWADASTERVWTGLRPCTPDGLPLIGFVDSTRSRAARRVVLATGHAMLGLTQAPSTGLLVRELLEGQSSATLKAVSPSRRFLN